MVYPEPKGVPMNQETIDALVDVIRAAQGREIKRLGRVRKPRNARKRHGAKPNVYAHPSKLAHAFREAHEYA